MKPINTLLISTLALCSFSSATYADTILHAFNWKYSDVTANANQIAQAGYKKYWLLRQWNRAAANGGRATNLKIFEPLTLLWAINKIWLQWLLHSKVWGWCVCRCGAQPYGEWKLEAKWLDYPGTEVLNDYASRSSYYADQTLFGNLAQGFVSANDFMPRAVFQIGTTLVMFNIGVCVGLMAM